MTGHTIRLTGAAQREYARRLILAAPDYAVVTINAGDRTLDQNSKMWAMLSDVSRAKPEGRKWTPETWKCAFLHSLGRQVQFAEGLDGSGPFPLGFRSSKLNKAQMADLITVIQEYGDRHGVAWQNEVKNA
jgi:NinB protein